jgi:8-oxo-dGTP pyrophosphatase MutT (NUDIX family)
MYVRRVAIFTLIDLKGRVLLQHRDKDAPTWPDYWAFFGGEIDDDEPAEDAVAREAMEELGTTFDDLTFYKRYEIPEADGIHEKHVFTGQLRHSIEVLRQRQREGDDLGLFGKEELGGLKMNPPDLVILRDLLKDEQNNHKVS